MNKYILLLLPIISSITAQITIKFAGKYTLYSSKWIILMLISIVFYLISFVLYSFAVRHFPISIASAINTVAVMVGVYIIGIFFLSETKNMLSFIGVLLGVVSVILISTSIGKNLS